MGKTKPDIQKIYAQGNEGDLKRQVEAVLKHYPRLMFWPNNTGSVMRYGVRVKYGHLGSGDFLGLIAPSGRMVAIETKTKKGVQSPDQIKFQREFEAHGGWYILCREMDDLKPLLEVIK